MSDSELRIFCCTVAGGVRFSGAQGIPLLVLSATRNDVASLGRAALAFRRS
jgi:CHASE1-domain containing sensor protein